MVTAYDATSNPLPHIFVVDGEADTRTVQEFDTIAQSYTAAYELADTYPHLRLYTYNDGKLRAAYTESMGWH